MGDLSEMQRMTIVVSGLFALASWAGVAVAWLYYRKSRILARECRVLARYVKHQSEKG